MCSSRARGLGGLTATGLYPKLAAVLLGLQVEPREASSVDANNPAKLLQPNLARSYRSFSINGMEEQFFGISFLEFLAKGWGQ